MNSLIQNLKNFLMTCPYLNEQFPFNVDHVEKKVSYAIIVIPSENTTFESVCGDKTKELQFSLQARAETDGGKEYIDNQVFLENVINWIDEQNEQENFPEMVDPTVQTPIEIRAVNNGYLSERNESGQDAVYAIECVFEYEQKGAYINGQN